MFLEEAAGVSKYKERRRETEIRLADTRENLLARRRHPPGARRAARAARGAGRSGDALPGATGRAAAQAGPALATCGAAKPRRSASATRSEIAQGDHRARSRDREAARAREATRERCATTHYAAGDAMHAAQGALYEANAEVARLRVGARAMPRNAQRIESQNTERRAQLDVLARAARAARPSRCTPGRRARCEREAAGRANAQQLEAETRAAAAGRAGLPRERRKRCDERAQRAGAGRAGRLQVEQANLAHLERGVAVARAARASACRASCRRWSSPTRMRSRRSSPAWPALRDDAGRSAGGLRSAAGASTPRSRSSAPPPRRRSAQRSASMLPARSAARHPAADPGCHAEENAPLQEWLGRHGLAQRRAPVAEHAHRARLGNGGGVGAARAPERARADDASSALGGAARDHPPGKASVFEHGSAHAPAARRRPGLPLASKSRAAIRARRCGRRLAAGVVAVEGTPDARDARGAAAGQPCW